MNFLIAAAIIAVQGMRNTLEVRTLVSCQHHVAEHAINLRLAWASADARGYCRGQALGPGGELDERGVGHMTAQVQINNGDNNECILYCARGTVFNGEMRVQGLGVDASRCVQRPRPAAGVGAADCGARRATRIGCRRLACVAMMRWGPHVGSACWFHAFQFLVRRETLRG